jgi:hypothetical protein
MPRVSPVLTELAALACAIAVFVGVALDAPGDDAAAQAAVRAVTVVR